MARPARLLVRVLLALVGLPLLLVGLWALPRTVPEFIRQYRASRWPAVQARIVKAEGAEALFKVGGGQWWRRWDVTWEYNVAGRAYSGAGVTVRMANELDAFQPGGDVWVNYSPRDPAVGVWHEEDRGRARYDLLSYGFLLLLGAGGLGGAWALGGRRA
jgi:hypothetical protein